MSKLRFRLRQQILLGYIVPFLLLFGVMSLVFTNLQTASSEAELLKSAYTVVNEIKDLAYSLSKMQRTARGYLLVKDPVTRQNYIESENEFKNISASLLLHVKDPQQQSNLQRLLELGGVLTQQQNQLIKMVDENNQIAAVDSYRSGNLIDHVREMEKIIQNFDDREMEILNQRESVYETSIDTVVNSIIYGTLGSILLAGAIALWLATAISRSITTNASQLSAASSEIAATITQHERTASLQAAAANETYATIEELSVSSRRSAEQATNAAALAEKSGAATLEGGEVTRQTVAAMSRLKKKISAMAEQILRLGDKTSQIGNIASLVKDLSAQINMLALNASVEAARAGEHGKGFAVVASEVRKLADESKKSAEQASLLVAEVQKATNSSVMMTEEGAGIVDEVSQLTGKVATLFENLAGMAGAVNENAQQVMLNGKQQSAAFSQVVEATNSIATGTKETAAGISQTKVGVQKLNEAAENLKAIT